MNAPLPESTEIVVIGAGQAGLSMSWHLTERRIPHVVLERRTPGHAWRTQRWESFCLVTPNWQCRLPGFAYAGPDPDGFMLRDDIVRYVEDYARSFAAPIRTLTEVRAVRRAAPARFEVTTDRGTIRARQVVVATGGYHRPVVPAIASMLPPGIAQISPFDYRSPESLAPGAVLVVGSGQSGAQIAEDLLLAGRDIHLAVGRAPRVSRAYRGRDVVGWLDLMGFYDLPVERHPLGAGVRDNTNHYVTGRDGGRDIDLRVHARAGLRLHGRLLAGEAGVVRFADDLAENLDRADATNGQIKRAIDDWIAAQGIDAPPPDLFRPVWSPEPGHGTRLDLARAGVTTIVWATGFRMDFGWIEDLPTDAKGRPSHVRGVSTDWDGLMFLGLPWLHSWGSGRFSSVGRDAAFLADRIGGDRRDCPSPDRERQTRAPCNSAPAAGV